MKTITNVRKIAVFAFIAVIVASCTKDQQSPEVTPEAKQSETITEVAKSNPELSNLVEALTKAELTDEFSDQVQAKSKVTYTIFAPTNKAFMEFLKANKIENLKSASKQNLRDVLLNHVVMGAKKAAELKTEYLSTLSQVKISGTEKNYLSLFVNTTDGVMLNGESKVIKADIKFCRGVIHIVDKVIPLPSIVTHAKANPNFSTLLAVVTSPEQAAIATALTTSKKPLTVFAPINAAFDIALGTGGFANGATAAQVTKVLQYHVVGDANVLAASLKEGQVVTTLLGQQFTIGLTGGAKIKDQAGNTINIIATDVQCTNGVVHAIDRVLQPAL
jgi:uncharacterized surface protein with fasciclin (FAS1) repeats